MNTVYVLVALVFSGNWLPDFIVPTMEFKTLEKCEAAITTLKHDIQGTCKTGSAKLRCVKIEK
jgi:hypothetical protein